MKSSALIIPILLVILAGILLFFWGTPAPTVSLNPDAGPIAARRELTVKLETPRGGLKRLTVVALQGDKKVDVLVKTYASGTPRATETFTLVQSGLQEGPFTLQISATGSSILRVGGKTTTQTRSFTYENKPPAVAVLSIAHNISRGGAGLVVYTVSKEVTKTGVVFADRFVPGFRQEGDFYACLFPFPYNLEPNRFVPRVIAVDRAGNERVVDINYHLIPKVFPTDRIDLSDTYLEKIAAEFKDKFPQAATPLDVFLKANNELRQQDAKTLFEYARQTSPKPLWQGNFVRLPNSAPKGSFAQFRTYVYQGKAVDQQTHLGQDLASLAHSPVPAANRGKVVHAGDLGLYGQCIIIDHGLGLQSLYGHLSRMSVKAGDTVEKGQVIGNTGATGMAGGDHLHYGVIVSGEPVNPIEWWDSSWIKNNVTGKLEIGKTATRRP